MIGIGRVSAGKVREAGLEHIETTFFSVVLPLFPLRSTYFPGELAEPFAIRLSWRSVILGYLRRWVGLGGTAAGIGVAAHSIAVLRHDPMSPVVLSAGAATVLCLVLSILLTWKAGRSSLVEKRKRYILKMVANVGALPSMLYPAHADRIRAQLEKRWSSAHTGVDWRQRSESNEVTRIELPLLFALSLYEAAREPTAANERRAEAAWLQVEDSWNFEQIEL